ncbi:MAG: tape measure protein [Candidatus Nanopelagicales bacterium]
MPATGAEVAVAYVTLLPSFRGGAAAISKQLRAPTETAGRELGERIGRQAAGGLSRTLGQGLVKQLQRIGEQAPALKRAALPLTDFIAGFRSSEAAASAFTGRLGTLGGAAARASVPLKRLGGGLREVGGYASGLVGKIGDLGANALPRLGSAAATAAANLAKLVALAGAGAAAVFTAIGGYALKSASDLQQANVAFETLLGSQSAAQGFIDQLRTFAKATPFELPGLTVAAQQLLGFGFAADKVLPILQAAGDAAAGLGRGQAGVDSFVRALGQIQAKGRVQGDELLQLSELGVNGLQILADTAGTTTVEMQKLIEKGLVPADFAVQALVSGVENGTKNTKAFGGLMAKQAQTLAGVFSNLKDALTIGLSDGLAPALPAITEAIKTLQPSITSFATSFGTILGPALTNLAQTVAPALVDGFAQLAPLFADLATKGGDLLAAVLPVGTSLLQVFGTGLLGIMDALTPAIEALTPSFQAFASIVADELARSLPSLAPALLTLGKGLGDLFYAVSPLVPFLGELARAVLPAVAWAMDVLVKAIAFAEIGTLQWQKTLLGAASTIVQDFVGGALASLLDGLATVAGIIPGVGDGLAQSARQGADSMRVFASATETYVAGVDTRLQEVQTRLSAMAQGTTIPVTLAVQTSFVNTSSLAGIAAASKTGSSFAPNGTTGTGTDSAAYKALQQQYEGLLAMFRKNLNGKRTGSTATSSKAAQARSAVLDTIAGTFVRDLVTAKPEEIKNRLKGLISQVRDALSGGAEKAMVARIRSSNAQLQTLATQRQALLAKLQDVRDLKTRVRQSVMPDITILPRSGPGLVRALAKRLDTLKRFRANIATLIKRGLPRTFLQQLIDAGLDGADTAAALVRANDADFTKIKQLASGLNTQGKGLAETAAVGLYGAGVDSTKGLVNGLLSQIKTVENAMTKIATAMVKALKKKLGIKSPSRIGRGIGANFTAAVPLGVVDELPTVAKSSDRIASALTSGLGTAAPARTRPGAGVGAGGTYIEQLTVQQHAPRTYVGSTAQALRDLGFLTGRTA